MELQQISKNGEGNHPERFSAQDSQQRYQNAQKLGFFAGSVNNAVKNIETSDQREAELVKDFIGTTSALLGGAVGIPNPVAGFTISASGEGVKRVVDAYMDEPDKSIAEYFDKVSIPFDPKTNDLVYTGTAKESYGNEFRRLSSRN